MVFILTLKDFFDTQNIMAQVAGYPLSYIEFISVISGLLAVWYASRANILTWAVGIVNILTAFVIFYQVQLYADMFLQVYYMVVTVIGWLRWKKSDAQIDKGISFLSNLQRFKTIFLIGLFTIIVGYVMQNLPYYLPSFFPQPTAYPYIDSYIAVLSVAAMLLMAQKKVENWWLWIMVDCIACVLYYIKDIKFIAFQYFIFLLLALYGAYHWQKKAQLNPIAN